MAEWKKIITSGSDAVLNTITANGITSDLTGTASVAEVAVTASYISASNIDGAAGVLTSPITTSLSSNIGSVEDGTEFDTGTSLEDIITQMLVEFIPPTFNSFKVGSIDISGDGSFTSMTNILEVGDTTTVAFGQYTTSSDSTNGPFSSLEITISGMADPALTGQEFSGDTTGDGKLEIRFDSKIVTRTTPGDVHFVLSGEDSQGTIHGGSFSGRRDTCGFHLPIFFGGSPLELTAEDLTTDGDNFMDSLLADISGSSQGAGASNVVVANGQVLLSSKNSTSFGGTNGDITLRVPSSAANNSNGASHYTYIVYPSSYGALTKILLDFVQSEMGTFTNLGTGDHTRFGVTTTYFVYKSAGKGPYSTSNLITIADGD